MCDRLKNRKLPHYWKENKVWPKGNSCLGLTLEENAKVKEECANRKSKE
jgi:hypothetical protein